MSIMQYMIFSQLVITLHFLICNFKPIWKSSSLIEVISTSSSLPKLLIKSISSASKHTPTLVLFIRCGRNGCEITITYVECYHVFTMINIIHTDRDQIHWSNCVNIRAEYENDNPDTLSVFRRNNADYNFVLIQATFK